VVTAIGGTAGVGKTALAVHSAHRLLPQFPDGHLYADLLGYTAGQAVAGPDEVLEVFLRRLGVAGEEMPGTVEERSGLLRSRRSPTADPSPTAMAGSHGCVAQRYGTDCWHDGSLGGSVVRRMRLPGQAEETGPWRNAFSVGSR
jgi:hypothetical protein